MKAKLVLDRAARRRLQKLDRKRRDADIRVRIRVILKVALGLSCNAAARDVGCVPSTAVRTVARFGREGEASLLDPTAARTERARWTRTSWTACA